MTRVGRIVTAAVAAMVVTGALIASARVTARQRERAETTHLEARYRTLRDSLRLMAARDPLLRLARGGPPGVSVAVDETLLVDLVEEAGQRYLDRVEIDLEADFSGHGEGEVETGTPFGTMTLGDWKVVVTVHEMKGRLSTLRPAVVPAGGNRLDVSLPVRVLGGHGKVTLDFSWDSRGVFNMVCKDWKDRRTIEGAILPRSYVVRGDLVLRGGPNGIVADPDFTPERFPIRMDPSEESWDRIRSVLEEQNKLYRCGLLVKPDSLIEKLRRTGIEGLRFKLPRALLRPVTLPASVTETVRLLQAHVDISVVTDTLHMTPGVVWYRAGIQARRSDTPGVPLPLPTNGRS